MNSLARPPNHAAHIAAAKLQPEGDRSAVRNFRKHHVVRKFDQLANDELQKFSHPAKKLTMNPSSHNSYGVGMEGDYANFVGRPRPDAGVDARLAPRGRSTTRLQMVLNSPPRLLMLARRQPCSFVS